MLVFIAISHLIIAVILVTLILLQDSKGGAMGVLGGGGGSNTVFGSTGAANFLTKATRWVAVLFALTCFALAYMTGQKSESVFDNAPQTSITAPANKDSNPKTSPESSNANPEKAAAGAVQAEKPDQKTETTPQPGKDSPAVETPTDKSPE